MTVFDASQERVLALDPSQHARVLGAPGSGKTALVVECFARASEREGWVEGDTLVLAPNRLVATRLREAVTTRVHRALGGAPVRTASSFAFSILGRQAALRGVDQPRLLTGTVQDEAIATVILARVTAGAQPTAAGLVPDVLLSAPFRAELRELWRVLDDFELEPGQLAAQLSGLAGAAQREAFTEAPDPSLSVRWADALDLLREVWAKLAAERPDEVSASGLLRAAAVAVREEEVPVPGLIIVDDAQELGEGQLALLAACASAGSTIWAFGDPDLATGAFQGERAQVLAGVSAELARRGWVASPESSEQLVELSTVYRQGPELRGFVAGLSRRIGAAGTASHRAAEAADQAADQGEADQAADQAAANRGTAAADDSGAAPGADPHGNIQFARAASASEQLGVIAHRMRARRLGLDGGELSWNDMAVLCRTRSEAVRVARLLAAHQVPTGIASGGIVLREHQVVRELIALLQHALGIAALDAAGVLRIAGGVLGGLDAVAVRRLRGALLLAERREARAEGREPVGVDDAVYEAFQFPGALPAIDSAGGRVIRRVGLMAKDGVTVADAGGTAREVLWAIWDRSKLAERWQREALDGRGTRADEAGRALDAVMGLFFALQRHEEQDSEQPIAELLSDILSSTVPEDSLAQQSARQAVTVTTPQGVIGREFALVAVIGVQDGAWPNLRARGSLLGTAALERWLRGGQAAAPSRRDTIHDELRLFLHACARSTSELLVVATSDEESHPSPFFGFGAAYETEGLPSARLTLRGATAVMRQRIVADHADTDAAASLAALAAAEVPGAHPDEWYGVLPPSTDRPLFLAREGEEPRQIPVSPSQLERAETCPLDWVIATLGGGAGSVQASLGTLVHHALETATSHDPEELLEAISSEWRKLPFDAEWESERARRSAAQMAQGLANYLAEFERSDRQLLGRESSFSLDVGRAELRGIADRLELRETPEGAEVTIVDLKTGRTPATGPEAAAHVQLQAYQLGVALGAFTLGAGEHAVPEAAHTSAKLLYVHPDATRGKGYVERVQPELDAEGRGKLMQRVAEVAETMAAGSFTARIEHHCSDPHQPGNCQLHIIQAVSHA